MKKVLHLDDERISHLLVHKMTENNALSWQIKDSYFWKEALHLIEGESFDLILADVHLQQHEQVWTLLEAMQRRKKNTPVVLVTAMACEATLREAQRFNNIRAVIEKPLPATLLPQINQWLN